MSHNVLLVPALQQLPFGGQHGRNNWWCAICGEKHDWKQPDRLLVVQTGESIDEARVFKAYTFMTQDEICLIKSWKENRDGSCKVFFHVPRFVDHQYFTVLSLHISNVYAKKKGVAKKLILTLRAIMISQEVDLVAGGFNGTAWRCRSKDNLSTVDEAFTDCALPTPWGPGYIPDNWNLNHRVLTAFGKCISMMHFPFHGKRLVYVPQIKVAWLHLDFVDWNNRWSKHDDQHISLKERPADYSYGTPKRRVSEVMSDHSLSS